MSAITDIDCAFSFTGSKTLTGISRYTSLALAAIACAAIPLEDPRLFCYLPAALLWRYALSRLDPAGFALTARAGSEWVLSGPAGPCPAIPVVVSTRGRVSGMLWLHMQAVEPALAGSAAGGPGRAGSEATTSILVFPDALGEHSWRDLRRLLRLQQRAGHQVPDSLR